MKTTYNIDSHHGINLTLKQTDKGLVFSASGFIWNKRKTDYACCGQMLDELAELFPKDSKVQRITSIWKDWHLNDMQAGTVKQEALVKGLSYKEAVEVLTQADLLIDEGYKYGTSRLFREIPADVLSEIESWFE